MKYSLKTPRLRLRPCMLSDLAAIHMLWRNEQIRQFLFDRRVISTDEARAFVEASLSNFEQHGYGLWLIFAKEQAGHNRLIGFAGAIPAEASPSLIYGIHPDFWGRGYATEATSAVLDSLMAQSCPKVIADVDEPNLASVRVLQKLGMTQTKRAVVNQPPLLYFERLF